jgi:hypothetical protein
LDVDANKRRCHLKNDAVAVICDDDFKGSICAVVFDVSPDYPSHDELSAWYDLDKKTFGFVPLMMSLNESVFAHKGDISSYKTSLDREYNMFLPWNFALLSYIYHQHSLDLDIDRRIKQSEIDKEKWYAYEKGLQKSANEIIEEWSRQYERRCENYHIGYFGHIVEQNPCHFEKMLSELETSVPNSDMPMHENLVGWYDSDIRTKGHVPIMKYLDEFVKDKREAVLNHKKELEEKYGFKLPWNFVFRSYIYRKKTINPRLENNLNLIQMRRDRRCNLSQRPDASRNDFYIDWITKYAPRCRLFHVGYYGHIVEQNPTHYENLLSVSQK